VSKVTEKIKTRSKPTPSENFNSHPLYASCEAAPVSKNAEKAVKKRFTKLVLL
jgi:hypothetical protein